jgi:hypothetical protein
MAEVPLFHHAQGQTEGFLAFVDRSLPSYDADADAATLLTKRALEFLAAR